MNIWVGTSGFQYAEWKGTFYPEDLSTAKMLSFYAQRLSSTGQTIGANPLPR
jgi:uncharacterized protein YecE (DUF72 family)